MIKPVPQKHVFEGLASFDDYIDDVKPMSAEAYAILTFHY